VQASLALVCLILACGTARAEPTKRALLVGVSDYSTSLCWGNLSTETDIELMREALVWHGFAKSDIHVLPEKRATSNGIEDAIRKHLLDPAKRGDMAVFHYSGHGDRILDDDGDEPDGLDETLAPFGAPRSGCLPPNFRGGGHIRDDDLGELLTEVRRRVGKEGSVLVSLDSCHSGSATRGLSPARGWGDADAFELGEGEPDSGSGHGEIAGEAGDDDDLAPMAVFSAAPFDHQANELTGTGLGGRVGPLSYALSKALLDAEAGDTHAHVFWRVQRILAGFYMASDPQLEGDADARLFSGQIVAQTPYHVVVGQYPNEGMVDIFGGTLHGIHPGTTVRFMPAGTVDPREGTSIARGTVNAAGPTRAVVLLEGKRWVEGAPESWAFIDRYSFGDLRIQLAWMKEAPPAVIERVQSAVDNIRTLELVESGADLLLRWNGETDLVEVVDPSTGNVRLPLADCRDEGHPLACDLAAHARSLYLRRLEIDGAPDLDVKMEINPGRGRGTDGRLEGFEAVEPRFDDGGRLTFREGEQYRVKIWNDGSSPAFVTVLGLYADGSVAPFYPNPQSGVSDLCLESGQVHLSDVFMVTGPAGMDVLKLFATTVYVDFGRLLQRPAQVRTRGTDPLGDLFADSFPDVKARGRSSVVIPTGTGATYSVVLRVETAE